MPFDSIPPEDPVLQYLRDTRARLKKGWTQGDAMMFIPGHPRKYCMLGALAYDDQGIKIPTAHSIGGQAVYHLKKVLQIIDVFDIVLWNDNPRRTKAQVLRAMDRAIKHREKLLADGEKRRLARAAA